MRELPAAFNALANYRQWVIWAAIPNKKNPDKFDKITVNPSTGLPHDAHDQSIWFDAGSALTIASKFGESFGVGFVFTKQDPFWFFDLDGCLTESGEWTQNAQSFCAHFAGAAIEISHSGKGLHIIGSGSQSIGDHAKKNVPLGLEFYTEKRFVALTGTGIMGDAAFDASALLPNFCAYYFPPKTVTVQAEWTTEPDPMSRPLKTDQALIKKMIETTNAGNVFGTKVSARDLWECNIERLATAYPSFNPKDPFDRSSADQALCNHLAFWTGKDCARIESLFAKSGLLRDKWQKREQYRKDTILKAVSACQAVYGSSVAEKEQAKREWNPQELITNTEITANGGASIVAYEQRPEFFKGHYFLTETSKVFCPDGITRGQTEYNAMYSTHEFAAPFGGKPVTEAWKAYVTATDMTRAEVLNTAYRPEYDFGITFKESGNIYVNSYVNRDGARIEGDATPFINHIKIMLPNGRDAEILLSWMAALVQYPGKKFLWSPFLQGVEGNGKSLIGRILSYCIGEEHVEDVDPEDFCNSGGKFNAYMKNNRLAILEEIKTGSRNQAEAALKRFIGSLRIQVQGKGVDQNTVRTCINWLINSNHKDAIHITDHTRRFAVLFCAQQEKEDLERYDMQRGGHYFSNLFDWFHNQNGWAITANWLARYEIPAEFNPATDADKAPMTTSFIEAIKASRSTPHQAVVEILSCGKPGTLGGWCSVQVLNKLLREEYGIKPPSGKMISQYLKAEGYVKHPALSNQGRATRAIMAEGNNRSVIYVKSQSIQWREADGRIVTDMYMKAQGYSGAPNPQSQGMENEGLS